MSNSILGTGFQYRVEVVKDGVVTDSFLEDNLMPQVSVDFVANLLRGAGASPISSWYIGIYEGNFTPDANTTPSDLQTEAEESMAYEEESRPSWQHSYDGEALISNADNRAEFTMNASKEIHGAFVISSNSKGGDAGTLLSIARFSSPRQVEEGSVLRITAGITLTPTGTL